MEPTQVVVKGTVEYVCSCCEASLKRLGVDYIDLYYVHWIYTSGPIEETHMWGAMGDVKVVDLGSDFFLVRLSNRDDYDHVLFDGPWVIAGHYLSIRKWHPEFRPSEASH
ncbi:Perakine reductase [Camellia lanceoleosa]|uniref:Perakine reductase n=1 Tax=Camellia lanceoleosa TaxID=1840588 RepID=A0ACC0IKC4_9ERIC|nr:Perakine reductase [Camellia lanceoleosa]